MRFELFGHKSSKDLCHWLSGVTVLVLLNSLPHNYNVTITNAIHYRSLIADLLLPVFKCLTLTKHMRQ